MIVILNSILPAFILIALGFILKRKGVIEECTDKFMNDLAYYLVLPCMIFSSIYKTPFDEIFNGKIVIGLYIASFSVFLLSIAASKFFRRKMMGAFVTSSFRSNIAYIGFPLVFSMYGETGLAKISVVTGFIAPVIIGTSIIFLGFAERDHSTKKINIFSILLKDPLIVTCIVVLLFSYYKIWLPKFFTNTIDLIALMGAPLMLMTVGSGLKIESIRHDKIALGVSSFIKLLILPAVSFIIFKYFIIISDPVDFNIAVLTLSFPTALSSYVLVKKYEGDYDVVASAITVSTIISLFTISGWMYFLTS